MAVSCPKKPWAGRHAILGANLPPSLNWALFALLSRLPMLAKGWLLVSGEGGHVVVAVTVIAAGKEWTELSICQSTLHSLSLPVTALLATQLFVAQRARESALPRTKGTPRLEDGLT
jgi:hypothetical protein